jgi:hypothetical protein
MYARTLVNPTHVQYSNVILRVMLIPSCFQRERYCLEMEVGLSHIDWPPEGS